MSFSADVKRELSGVSISKKHCQCAELAGIIYMAASISLSRKGMCLNISTESMDVIKRTISLMERLYRADTELSAIEQPPKRTLTYLVRAGDPDTVRAILGGAGLFLGAGILPDKEAVSLMLERDCCKRAFVRGAFLGGGSISDPKKDYHLEFVTSTRAISSVLTEVLAGLGIKAADTERKESSVVYIKECDSIIELLSHAGAHSAVLELENIRIYKSINNDINRAYNCESANIDRQIRGAEEQIKCIRIIADSMGIEKLPLPLRQAAELRLANPSASLAELSAMSDGASRSVINHRMRRIREIAGSVFDEEDI